ncbi:GSCOCG00009855001-RA-CDS [Cotesia congregata]|nr:GSCOCG00009855001-RA-CDS [Cotesia congregata]
MIVSILNSQVYNNLTICIIGVILNAISFGILSKPILRFCDSGLSLYLRALAISDNAVLIFDYGVGVARSNFSAFNTLFMNSKFLCGFNSVSMEFFQITSTWLVVSLTWARVAAIIFPLQTFNKNHDCSAIIVIIILTCLSLIVSLTKLYCGGYESDSVFEYVTCQKIVIPWGIPMYFYIAFCTWLPLLFIFIGNVLLICHMRKSDVIHIQLTRTVQKKLNFINGTSGTLLAVSIVHLILLLPIGFVETLELYWDVILKKYPSKYIEENQQQYISWLQEKMLLKWCRGLFFHIYHWNFAINFILYYWTGKTFRDRVISALRSGTKFLCLTSVVK